MYVASYTTKGWRIRFVNGEFSEDLCGAIDSSVAWATAGLLNRMRGYK